MALHEYSVWFRNKEADPSDQDYEWVASFIVDAPSAPDAKRWGDELSRSYASRNSTNEYRSSEAFPISNPKSAAELPVVEYGVTVSDQHIGW